MTGALGTSLAVVTVACVTANVLISIADFRKAQPVLANAAEVGLQPATVPYLGALKFAGAAGLVVGFAGPRWLGLAAGVGLVLFFVVAVGAHVRARVFHNVGVPLTYLALAIGATVYFAHAV